MAKHVKKKYSKQQIIIAGDNDSSIEGNPGLNKAKQAAEAIDALHTTPKTRGDFNDVHVELGLDEVRHQLENVTRVFPIETEPIPFWKQVEKEEPFPVDAFPKIIKDAILEYHKYGQQPLPMICSSALAALSLVCQPYANVARDNKLIGPISLNIIVIAESGERKSTADSHFKKPINDWLADRQKETAKDVTESTAKHQVWESKKKGITTTIQSLSKKFEQRNEEEIERLESELIELEKNKPVIKAIPEMFYGDTNPSGLGKSLTAGYPNASIWSDEGGVFVGSHGMNVETRLQFMGMLNKLWDNGEYSNNRSTVASTNIKGCRITCSLMMQPVVIRELLNGSGQLARGVGMLSRYLICWPKSTIGQRAYKEPSNNWKRSKALFDRLITILNISLPVDEKEESLVPQLLCLSSEAKKIWIEYHDAVEKELGSFGTLFDVKDLASKSAENAARIATFSHVFGNGLTGDIDVNTMKRAYVIAFWYLRESQRVLSLVNTDLSNENNGSCLLKWLCTHPQAKKKGYTEGQSFTCSELCQYGPNKLRKPEIMRSTFKILHDNKWIIQEIGNKKRYVLNSKSCGLFDEFFR